MENAKKQELTKLAAQARMLALDAIYSAKSGHPGGSLSVVDVLTLLYNGVMNVDPADSKNPSRDRLVLSKGHAAPALYAVLAQKGYFPVEDLKHLRSVNYHLSGHVEMNHVNGVDMSAGSLGQGMSAAVGMALAGKLDSKAYRVYAIMGDGEITEGQIWEAALAAAHYKLDNFCGMVDVNGLQIDGTTEQVMNTNPLDEKFRAFGWHVITVDGHNFDALEAAFAEAAATKGQPTMLLLKTVKGKGVSFIENQVGWHGKCPSEAEFQQAMAELEKQMEV